MPGNRAARGSVDREVPRDDAVLEDAAAAVGEMTLPGKALKRSADRFGPVSRYRRHVLGEVVAKAAAGDEDRFEAADPEHLVAFGGPGGPVEVDEDRIELRRRRGDVPMRGVVHDGLVQVEPA